MGLRQKRPSMIFSHTATVGALKAAGDLEVVAHCGTCGHNTTLDLDVVEANRGPLYTFWNKHPPCQQEGCQGRLTYQAKRPTVWPVHMTEADQGQVDFLDAAWRADRINGALGGQLALQVAIAGIQLLRRHGVGTDKEIRQLVGEAAKVLPAELQEDGRWLLQHYFDRGLDLPGWR